MLVSRPKISINFRNSKDFEKQIAIPGVSFAPRSEIRGCRGKKGGHPQQKKGGHPQHTVGIPSGMEEIAQSALLSFCRWLGNYLYVDSLLAAIHSLDLKLNLLVLGQRLETLGDNAAKMDKNLLAILASNESVALLAIEPFYFTNHSVTCIKVNYAVTK